MPVYNFGRDAALKIVLAQALISVISDFGLALYPILIIAHLKLTVKDKVGLCALMGLGVM